MCIDIVPWFQVYNFHSEHTKQESVEIYYSNLPFTPLLIFLSSFLHNDFECKILNCNPNITVVLSNNKIVYFCLFLIINIHLFLCPMLIFYNSQIHAVFTPLDSYFLSFFFYLSFIFLPPFHSNTQSTKCQTEYIVFCF